MRRVSETDHQQYRIVGDYHVNMAFPDACLCCHDALLGTILIDGVCFRCWVEQEIKPLRAEHRTLVDAVEQDEYLLRKLASGEWRVKMISGSSSGMKKLATILLALLPQDSEEGGGE